MRFLRMTSPWHRNSMTFSSHDIANNFFVMKIRYHGDIVRRRYHGDIISLSWRYHIALYDISPWYRLRTISPWYRNFMTKKLLAISCQVNDIMAISYRNFSDVTRRRHRTYDDRCVTGTTETAVEIYPKQCLIFDRASHTSIEQVMYVLIPIVQGGEDS